MTASTSAGALSARSAVGSLTVSECATTEAFRALASEWDDLLERSGSRSACLAWGWLFAWWSRFQKGRTLKILTVRDVARRLVGVAPFCVQSEGRVAPLRALSFLGTERVSSDYLDIIAESGREEGVSAALWDALRADRGSWDLLRLTDLLDDSLVLRLWKPSGKSQGFMVDEKHCQLCPYLPLAETVEAFRKSLGSSQRQNLRKKGKRLEEAGVTFGAIEDVQALPAALERFYELHRARWRTKGMTGNFEDPRVLAFHEEVVRLLSPTGKMRLYELRAGSRMIAGLYGLQLKDTFFCYQTGFDPTPPSPDLPATKYSPGVVMIGRCMEDAVQRGLRVFDFMRGPEPYKFEWTRQCRETKTLTLVPPENWPARIRFSGELAVRGAKGIVKRIIGRKPPGATSPSV